MRFRFARAVAAAATALLCLGGVTACGAGAGTAGAGDRLDLVTAFYPLQFVAERVGGDAVRVTNLVRPGVEPHDLELSTDQVGKISEAGLVVHLAGFQPQIDEAVEQNARDRAFDVAAVQPLRAATGGHDHAGDGPAPEADGRDAKDPHVWLDPIRLASIGGQLAERLGKLDPERAAGYRERAGALRADLQALDAEYQAGLRTCQRRELVTSHEAFGYLTDRYHLEQVGISGLTPESEPSAQRLGQVAAEAREHGATTIFFETLVSPKVAETIAREVGATTAVLDPLEGLRPGSSGDYLSVMRTNLATLRTALGCS